MEYITEHGKSYATREEYEFRLDIFKNRLDEHKEHNAKNLTWTIGVNFMTDMSDDEIKGMMGFKGLKGTPCGSGECPIDNAVCCSDNKHCCPHGYTCDLAAGTCDKSTSKIPFELLVAREEPAEVDTPIRSAGIDWRT